MSFKSICLLGLIAILLAIPAIESRRRHSHRHSYRPRFSDEFMGRELFHGGGGAQQRNDHIITLYGRSDQDFGEWGEMEFCHPYHVANSAQLKVEAHLSVDGDDTAVTGIRLGCPNAPNSYIISSLEGDWGEWEERQRCPGGQRIIGFERRVYFCTNQFECDDTATTGLRIICADFRTGQRKETLDVVGSPWGDWEGELLCPSDSFVCGIRTQVDDNGDETLENDYTGVNGVDMACCHYKSS